MNEEAEHLQSLDAATSKRLAKLREKNVDTAAIEQRIEAAIERAELSKPMRLRRWLSPIAGVAASILAVAGIYLAFTSGSSSASAATIELSQLHRDIVAGQVPMTPAESIEQANLWIAGQTTHGPELPGNMQDARVESCCLTDVHGDLVAVALMRVDDAFITLVVAKAPDFAQEMGTVIEIEGRRYFGHQHNGINMAMANSGDRWLCVMGDADFHRLAQIASQAKF